MRESQEVSKMPSLLMSKALEQGVPGVSSVAIERLSSWVAGVLCFFFFFFLGKTSMRQ